MNKLIFKLNFLPSTQTKPFTLFGSSFLLLLLPTYFLFKVRIDRFNCDHFTNSDSRFGRNG